MVYTPNAKANEKKLFEREIWIDQFFEFWVAYFQTNPYHPISKHFFGIWNISWTCDITHGIHVWNIMGTFTMDIPPMLAYLLYMDPMDYVIFESPRYSKGWLRTGAELKRQIFVGGAGDQPGFFWGYGEIQKIATTLWLFVT